MSVAMEDWPRRHQITVDEYHRIAQAGLLAPDARVELIEGEIVDMPPLGSRHTAVVTRLHKLLERGIGDHAIIRCQAPLQLSDFSEPEPDLSIHRPRQDFYSQQHPTAADTMLVIEVSDSTLRQDLQTKVPLYARHGIGEVWVVDLASEQLRVFRDPASGSYVDTRSTEAPGVVSVKAVPGGWIDLSSVFD